MLLTTPLTAADTFSIKEKFNSLNIDAVFPGDPSYTKFSGSFNKRFEYVPAAIVFPKNTKEVQSSIKVAVDAKLPVSARSGGHSYAAYGLGGANGFLVIDLQKLRTIAVNISSGEATIGAGTRLGDMAISLYEQGRRALPHGSCPYVGLGGHAAFGGFGLASRQWGLTLDTIVGHEVVLANGSIVSTSKTTNSELFWALRGAGPSFGIVTAFQFQTYPAPSQMTRFLYKWSLNQTQLAASLVKYQEFCASGPPPQLGVIANLFKGSGAGTISFHFGGCWYGEDSGLDAIVEPFLSQMPAPASKSVKKTDWLTSLQIIAGNQNLSSDGVDLTNEHDTFYAKSLTTSEAAPMSEASLHIFAKYLVNEGFQTDTTWFVQFELYGGKNSAINSVRSDETAFVQRSILLTLQFYASSPKFMPPFPESGLTFLDSMLMSIVENNPLNWPHGAYSNYVDNRLSFCQWKSEYYSTNWKRLSQIKSVYDPNELFSYPQSIPPAEKVSSLQCTGES
ncbi:hypothetical protein O181_081913 [Austropuccinia psidii MF-1]|uniref:FAD-binding PCMH-type domain-containing protein n=1 Tax=Austropuccinia psidii MF-1 TaxID=1389203 RepID=A0A9Q3IHZ2_9BASI|nr:hypothetical protein [Austropuccinia psidii MF-1]